MNHKRIGIIFAILYGLCIIPFPFTANNGVYLFGWLPFTLLYWWVLMFVNLAFVLWVCHRFVKSHENDKEDE